MSSEINTQNKWIDTQNKHVKWLNPQQSKHVRWNENTEVKNQSITPTLCHHQIKFEFYWQVGNTQRKKWRIRIFKIIAKVRISSAIYWNIYSV